MKPLFRITKKKKPKKPPISTATPDDFQLLRARKSFGLESKQPQGPEKSSKRLNQMIS